jgi:hypothetical protein
VARQVGGKGGAMLGRSSEEAVGYAAVMVAGGAAGDSVARELRAGCDAVEKEDCRKAGRPFVLETPEQIGSGR